MWVILKIRPELFSFLQKPERILILAWCSVSVGAESATVESLQFSLATIETATRKFSSENKIGDGGFGEVYKVITKCN